MAISPLLSIAGTALAPLARDVVNQITDGLSFHKLLARDNAASPDDVTPSSEHAANALPMSVEAKQLEAIRRQPLKELEEYVDRLRQRLSVAGIDLSNAIPLKVGLRGDIQVDGDHPDRAAIEDLLESDSQLASTFRLLANAFSNEHNAASGVPVADQFRLIIDASKFNLALE